MEPTKSILKKSVKLNPKQIFLPRFLSHFPQTHIFPEKTNQSKMVENIQKFSPSPLHSSHHQPNSKTLKFYK